MTNRWGKSINSDRFSFLGAPKSLQMVTAVMKLRRLLLGRKAMTNLYSILKRRGITLPTKVHIVKAVVFPVVVWMWEWDRKEGWAPKNWCFKTVVLEKTLESLLDSKIKPVNPKGNQLWIFIGRTEADAAILWPPDGKSQLLGKDPDAGKNRAGWEKAATENEIVGWHHRLNGQSLSNLWEIVKDRKPWCAAVHGVTKSDTP